MALLIGSLASLGFVALLVAYATVFRKLREVVPEVPPGEWAPVSIFKPLKGDDEGLYENLTAVARQEYPDYEVLFCAEDPNDAALDVARRVQAENPGVAIRVLSGGSADGMNPKVRVLRRLMAAARHEWLLVSDSNCRPTTTYLEELRGYQVSRSADLVTTLLCGVGEGSLGARLENLQLNSWVAASLTATEAGGHPCVIGKTMFMRRSALEAVGGFDGVRDILAEDYMLGARMTAAGFKVATSPYRMPVVSGARDIRTFFNRHVRWGQLRRRIAPLTFLAEFVVQPTPWFILTALLGGSGWQVASLVCLAIKFGVEVVLFTHMAGRPRPSLVWLPIKDLLVFVMWFVSATRTTVSWRGTRMRIGAESRLSPAEASGDFVQRAA